MSELLSSTEKVKFDFYKQALERVHLLVSLWKDCCVTEIEEKADRWEFVTTLTHSGKLLSHAGTESEIYAYSPDKQGLALSTCSGAFRVILSHEGICTISDDDTGQCFLKLPILSVRELEELLWFALNAESIGRVATDKADMPFAMAFESLFMPIWDGANFVLFNAVAETPFGETKRSYDVLRQAFQPFITLEAAAAFQVNCNWKRASFSTLKTLERRETSKSREDVALFPDGNVLPVEFLSEVEFAGERPCPPFLVFRVHPNFCFMHAMDLLRTRHVLDALQKPMSDTAGLFDFLSQHKVTTHRFSAIQLFASILGRSQTEKSFSKK